MQTVKLIPPSLELAAEILAFRNAFCQHNMQLHGSCELHRFDDIAEWLNYVNTDYINLFNYPKVPDSTYLLWHCEDKKVIGTVNIRHRLETDMLKNVGGHIGYSIHPDYQQQGYGKTLLKLALEKTDELGIKRVMVSCEVGNLGSEGVILSNGGVLDAIVEYEDRSVSIKRFWISR